MRDNHQGMPQLLAAIEEPEGFFGLIRCQGEAGDHTYRIGLQQGEYRGWRKVLTMSPYDPLCQTPCRYYFAGAGRHGDRSTYGRFRIEQESDGRDFEIDLPEHMVANLVWFLQLQDPSEAAHLLVQKTKANKLQHPTT